MEPDRENLEEKRKELGRTDEPLEDELVEEFENTVTEGAERLTRTWRAMTITGLFGGIDVGVGILAYLAVKEATGSDLLAGAAFGMGREDELGRLAPGYVADLVVLDASGGIRDVMVRGQWHVRSGHAIRRGTFEGLAI